MVAVAAGILLATFAWLFRRMIPAMSYPAWACLISAAYLLTFSWTGATAFLHELGVDNARGAIWLAGYFLLTIVLLRLAMLRDGRRAVLAAEIVLFALLLWPIYQPPRQLDPGPIASVDGIPPPPPAHRPSVFLFILDSYERSDVLARDFGHDNSPFVDALRARGFVVVDRARSSAHGSIRTVSRTFLHPAPYDSELQRIPLPPVLSGDNPVVRWFRRAGYSFVLAPGTVEPSESMRCVGMEDVCLLNSPTGPVLLVNILARLTPFWGTMRRFGVYPGGTLDLSEVLGRLERQLDEITLPTFFFAHLQALHQPYFPPADCPGASAIRDRYLEADPGKVYTAVLPCLNREMEAALDLLFERLPDAVVVIMGDHGSRIGTLGHPGPEWAAEAADARRYAVLLALRLPPRCRGAIDPAMTTADVFPVVLSCLSTGDAE